MMAYHGTTRDNANAILRGDTKPNLEGITWNCSDDLSLYLWCPEVLTHEVGDDEEGKLLAISQAFEGAQITAAISETPQSELVVLCFDFPEGEIEPDESCENMDSSRRVTLENYKRYHQSTLVCNHNPRLDMFILSGIFDNDHINESRIDDDMREACEALSGVWLDSLLEFDWMEE